MPWAREGLWALSACNDCGFIYMVDRPSDCAREEAVSNGDYSFAGGGVLTERRVVAKRRLYARIFGQMFHDLWASGQAVSWLDVGAGYGEILEAVSKLAPHGSQVVGVEPMRAKAEAARRLGIDVVHGTLDGVAGSFDVISLVNVFSHVHDVEALFAKISIRLRVGGCLFLETGDMTHVHRRRDFHGALDLPDHVHFACERHIRGFLERAGFEVLDTRRARTDGVFRFAKSIAKRLTGRACPLRLPYTSGHRTIRVRARLRTP